MSNGLSNIMGSDNKILDRVRIVLVEPTHPGNIGSVARAMKTMGLSQLVLVNPKKFPHYEANKLAAGAHSVLENARVVDSVEEAIRDCTLVLGTSVRDREVSWPTFDARETAKRVDDHLGNCDLDHRAAILFGRESSGLSNRELDLCQSQIRIDASQEYSSLNLANAVQIIAYELRMQSRVSLSSQIQEPDLVLTSAQKRQQSAPVELKEGYLHHLQNTLESLDFIKTKSPVVLMRKLTRLYNKADLSIEEIQILRGILSAVDMQIEPSGDVEEPKKEAEGDPER